MKKIKILTSLAAVTVLTGAATTIASCSRGEKKIPIPYEFLDIVDVTLKGLKEGTDISKYNTLEVPTSVKVVEENAFNNSKFNYENIKTLKFNRPIRKIRNNAFAGLSKLEVIDFSALTVSDIYYLEVGTNIFGKRSQTYCQIKFPPNLSDKALAKFKDILSKAGVDESWFVEPTKGNVEIKSEKKAIIYDGIDPTKQEAKLTKWVSEKNIIDVQIEKTGGTSEVDVKLIGQPTYERDNLTYNVELEAQAGYTLKDGDYNEYKLTVIQKTVNEASNETTTEWVEIIENCKVSYIKPEIYMTSMEAELANPEKIYHQDDVINNDDIIVKAVYNDRSKTVLPYGTDGYSVVGYEDFTVGHTLTIQDINKQSISFTIRYSKKGVGDFNTTITFNNLVLKVESIQIPSTQTQIDRGTTSAFTAKCLPEGSTTPIVWSIEPNVGGQSIEGVSINEETGVVTVADDAQTNPINVIATDATNPSIFGKKENISIIIPQADEVIFENPFATAYRGSDQQEYKLHAKVKNPACIQTVKYSITNDYSGKSDDEKVTIDPDSGVVTIGKLVPYQEQVTVRATATDGSLKYKDHTFSVDIPAPTKVIIENQGTTSMKRVEETRTFKATVEPDGAEQTVTWFARNKSDKALAGLTISDAGVLSATDQVAAQDIIVYAKNKPIDKPKTTLISSDKSTVTITYPDLESVEIGGGVSTLNRGATAATAFTATVSKPGAYKNVKWVVDEAVEGDGTSITTGGILKIGNQVKYHSDLEESQRYLTVRVNAYDTDGTTIKATNTVKVYYTIPPIESINIKVKYDPTPAATVEDGIHEQGLKAIYYVDSVVPVAAEMDVNFTFDKGDTTGVSQGSTELPNRECAVEAEEDAVIEKTYTVNITTVGKTESGSPLVISKTGKIEYPQFENATWNRVKTVVNTFESSAQDKAAAEAVCAAFRLVDIAEAEGDDARPYLFNFVKKVRSVNGVLIDVIDVCRDEIYDTGTKALTGKKALFTFEQHYPVYCNDWGSGSFSGCKIIPAIREQQFYKDLVALGLTKTVQKADETYSAVFNSDAFIVSRTECVGAAADRYKAYETNSWNCDRISGNWRWVWTRTTYPEGRFWYNYAYYLYNHNTYWSCNYDAKYPGTSKEHYIFPIVCV